MAAKRLVEGAIDFHVHPPWWVRSAFEACKDLAREADRAGFAGFVVIGFDGDESVLDSIREEDVIKAAINVADLILFSSNRGLERVIVDTRAELTRYRELFRIHRRTLDDMIACGEAAGARGFPVASYNPSDREFPEKIARLEGVILGVKIYPTFHMIEPHSKRLYRVYEAVREMGGLVIVHTGCDPGLWELPAFCSKARPSYVRRAARLFKDVTFVIAHLGSYSSLAPGIFFEEAVSALAEDNVYADTSAADPFYVERAIGEVGPDKILFGSDYPYVSGSDMDAAARDLEGIGLERKALNKIFRDNAVKLITSHWRGTFKI